MGEWWALENSTKIAFGTQQGDDIPNMLATVFIHKNTDPTPKGLHASCHTASGYLFHNPSSFVPSVSTSLPKHPLCDLLLIKNLQLDHSSS